jgi:hypothetical protein
MLCVAHQGDPIGDLRARTAPTTCGRMLAGGDGRRQRGQALTRRQPSDAPSPRSPTYHRVEWLLAADHASLRTQDGRCRPFAGDVRWEGDAPGTVGMAGCFVNPFRGGGQIADAEHVDEVVELHPGWQMDPGIPAPMLIQTEGTAALVLYSNRDDRKAVVVTFEAPNLALRRSKR